MGKLELTGQQWDGCSYQGRQAFIPDRRLQNANTRPLIWSLAQAASGHHLEWLLRVANGNMLKSQAVKAISILVFCDHFLTLEQV
jgi:hypothetical protein